MLMHVTPEEVHGLSSLRGGVTINPETGLPEAFPWLPVLAGAAIGGVGSAATGGDPLKGALLGGIGGFLPGAIGGMVPATATTGLGGLWNLMGPIGQGMLVGGAMGGVRSLWGDSDNPLRDVMLGAAMGGIGGAFGGDTGAADISDATVDAGTRGVSDVAMVGDPLKGTLNYNQAASLFSSPPSVSTPIVTPSTDFGSLFSSGVRSEPVASTASTAPTGIADAASKYAGIEQAGQPNWWDRRTTPQKIGLGLGAGVLGLAALEGPPEQAPIPGLTTASAIPEVGPFPFRTPIGGRDEEFYERTIGEGRTPEEAAYFTSEDVNVAKEGGLMSVIKRYAGSGTGLLNTFGAPSYAMGLTGNPDAMEVGPAQRGDPRYAKQLSLSDWNKAYGPNIGDDTITPAVSDPFEFPDVAPFASNAPTFNIEDVIARITGSGQSIGVPEVVTEQANISVPTDINIPTDTSALGDLLARFRQTASVDPIASSVSEVVTSSDGGTLELAVGGNTSVFEGRVQGQGDGMADQIAFNVIPQTPADIPNTPDMALLSSDEYVVPADVVSMLGNGSSTAGAQALDQFNKLMRHKAHGTNKQQREINPVTELSSLV